MSKDTGDTHPIVAELGVQLPKYPCPRHFGRGDSGDDVWAVQDGLEHWSKQNRPHGEKGTRWYAPTGTIRFPTVNQIKHFQDLHNLPQTGVVGPRTWNLLVPFMSGRALDKAKTAYKKYHPITVRDIIVRSALDGYANRAHIHYVQARPMIWHHRKPLHAEGLFAEDCSSFATWCYWVANAPDPNGMNFDGFGNTDSMISHCRRVELPKLGDLSLYTSPGHVAVVVDLDPITVISNGHYPMSRLPAKYGHPFVGYYTAINN